ncbi:hypothetical protein AVEN_263286-1 [Araneus ventricosus]|uniref:Uncharacterized protein n=1 Tax=Araneus ventricosus TaxID=182803 RepID=A0A4Y2HHM6_ARAVE|nr:hypothetical protein AVEN_263286-1 [Araneus ventricosus]
MTVTALSDLETQTVSKSLIMTVTALSIALSSPAFYLAPQTKSQSRSSRSKHTTQYRSASNSLLAQAVDKNSRMELALQRRSQSINTISIHSSVIQVRPAKHSLPRQAMTSH